MAFNFNWSPLLADTSRAREMLTSALNKSPKPPIIVDDIIVTELNLGTTPPELEILEIGDLAEDRFRGIFRMQYSGDAFLTLKTRVQANPLNTFLSDKPLFASPGPLAAASGLTIPIAITLSEIKLSGFVILVFSKQKGITVVFRNDPLESLKVSSTFDSISFVRNYLQRQIEGQLRTLFMDDLPAIIHKLSLRMWSSEHQATEENSNSNRIEPSNSEKAVDPLKTPSQRPFDALRPLEDAGFPSFALDNASEPYTNFSTKNLLRLAALSDSNRTLSLFTPSINDVVFRAWTGPNHNRSELASDLAPISSATLASLSTAAPSTRNSASSACSMSESGLTTASAPARPPMSTSSSVYGGASLSSFGGSKSRHHKKKKHRIVDLRKNRQPVEAPVVEDAPEVPDESRSTTPTSSAPSSSRAALSSSFAAPDDEVSTPPDSPEKVDKGKEPEVQPMRIHSPQPARVQQAHAAMLDGIASQDTMKARPGPHRAYTVEAADPQATLRRNTRRRHEDPPKLHHLHSTVGGAPEKTTSPISTTTPFSGGILEQAWMMKMASEIAQKAQDEKAGRRSSGSSFWGSSDGGESSGPPPPAYAA